MIDELAFSISTEDRPRDREMLRASRPTLATTNERSVILSSRGDASGRTCAKASGGSATEERAMTKTNNQKPTTVGQALYVGFTSP